jgi:TPR repeat protein
MAKAPQWNVKGVDDAARVVARDAAAKAGLPIGAWIGRAVLRVAREERRAIPPSTTPYSVSTPAVERGPEIVPPPPNTDAPPPVGPAPERDEVSLPPPLRSTDSVIGRWPRVIAAIAIMVVLTAGGVWLLGKNAAPPETGTTLATPQVATTTPTPSAPTVPPVPAPTAPPASAFDTLRQAAISGDARAQYELGVRYASGRDVPEGDVEAARWFERAAAQGYAAAQYNLGVLYDRGIGLHQDDKRAFFWYQSAADQGHPRAQHNLATAYADGKGTNQDLAAAARWFEKAANAGIAESQFYLGAIFERGLSGPVDRARALELYAQAARQGHKDAADRLAMLEANGTQATPSRITQPNGVTPAPPVADAPLPRNAVAEIQRLLARLDFDPGPADGVIGRKTNRAIADYQRMAGMTVDGAPSAMLLEELRAVAEAAKR